MSTAGTGSSGSVDTDICPTCGAHKGTGSNASLDQFLGRIGISDEMIRNLKSSMQNVDVEQYLNTARDYLKTSGNKAGRFAKEHPGKVAAGVAALAVGAGLIISAMNRDK
jgi:hypothetical protein